MHITPGTWEFHSTTTPLLPGPPREQVTERCIETATMNPEMLMKGMGSGCTLTDSGSNADSMSWSISCATDAGSSVGKGRIEKTSDDALAGGMTMSISMNGQENSFDMQWTGTYLGPCN
jgi:hypothetical protein